MLSLLFDLLALAMDDWGHLEKESHVHPLRKSPN